LPAIIGHQHRFLLFLSQRLVTFDADADGARKIRSPFRFRDHPALAALGHETALDQDRRNLRESQNREARAFDSAIGFGGVAEDRVIDASGHSDAVGIDAGAGLHIHETEGE